MPYCIAFLLGFMFLIPVSAVNLNLQVQNCGKCGFVAGEAVKGGGHPKRWKQDSTGGHPALVQPAEI